MAAAGRWPHHGLPPHRRLHQPGGQVHDSSQTTAPTSMLCSSPRDKTVWFAGDAAGSCQALLFTKRDLLHWNTMESRPPRVCHATWCLEVT